MYHVRMVELSTFQKILIIALAASWIVAAVRVARIARRLDRSPLKWFFITIFFSAIPATIVFLRDQYKRMPAGLAGADENFEDNDEPAGEKSRDGLIRCPHCREVIEGPENITGQDACPFCKQLIDGRHLA